jgi:hypothetical protein
LKVTHILLTHIHLDVCCMKWWCLKIHFLILKPIKWIWAKQCSFI